jgi:hypothetical protein
VSGAISGILAGDVMMSEAAAYNYGYRAGLADGGAGATVYKKNSQYGVPEGKVVEPNRTIKVLVQHGYGVEFLMYTYVVEWFLYKKTLYACPVPLDLARRV